MCVCEREREGRDEQGSFQGNGYFCLPEVTNMER